MMPPWRLMHRKDAQKNNAEARRFPKRMKKFARRSSGAGYMPERLRPTQSVRGGTISALIHLARHSFPYEPQRRSLVLYNPRRRHRPCANFTKLRNQQERDNADGAAD